MLLTIKPPMTPHDNMPHLQPTQDVNLHVIHTQTNPKSTHINKAHSPRDNTMLLVTTLEKTKQIIRDIDALSHSTTLWNKILKSLNHNGWCKSDNLCKEYLFENPNKPVNCSYILVFLKQSECYTITLRHPPMVQDKH